MAKPGVLEVVLTYVKPDAPLYKATRPEELPGLFDLTMEQTADYLPQSLQVLGMTVDEFRRSFESVGDVVSISRDGQSCGFYWIEKRENTLHIHALVLRPEMQRQGLGSAAMEHILDNLAEDISIIEVGVHHSNMAALGLCARLGFTQTKELPDTGFVVLRKQLSDPANA